MEAISASIVDAFKWWLLKERIFPQKNSILFMKLEVKKNDISKSFRTLTQFCTLEKLYLQADILL
jgi:hypothetical protein